MFLAALLLQYQQALLAQKTKKGLASKTTQLLRSNLQTSSRVHFLFIVGCSVRVASIVRLAAQPLLKVTIDKEKNAPRLAAVLTGLYC